MRGTPTGEPWAWELERAQRNTITSPLFYLGDSIVQDGYI